jgi:hypothetical protein
VRAPRDGHCLYILRSRPNARLFVWGCMSGGQIDQTLGDAGVEANLDTQYGFGLAFPTPGTFYSTGGSPPFDPDANTPTDTNEPYDDVRGPF